MESPLVSFITPTYNQEKYIADCIRSALAQTYTNWEQIIIDDGSTDRTTEIIKSFSDSRIKYFRQDNLGGYKLGVTYNLALQESKGELLAILEGDDFVPVNKLEIQVPYFSDKNVILTYGECIMTNESGKPIIYKKLINDESIGSPDLLQVRNNHPVGSALKEFVKYNFIFSQTVMIRKEALIKTGGFIQPDYLPLIDYPTWYRLALEGEFRGIPHLLGYFRRHSSSISTPLILRKEYIKFGRNFIQQHHQQIENLGINIFELELIQKKYITESSRLINCTEGISFLMLGMNRLSQQRFFSYLRQRNKNILLGIISLLGILCSISKLDFGSIYYRFSRPLTNIWRASRKLRNR